MLALLVPGVGMGGGDSGGAAPTALPEIRLRIGMGMRLVPSLLLFMVMLNG